MQESFWWWQCRDRCIISLFPHLHTPSSPLLFSSPHIHIYTSPSRCSEDSHLYLHSVSYWFYCSPVAPKIRSVNFKNFKPMPPASSAVLPVGWPNISDPNSCFTLASFMSPLNRWKTKPLIPASGFLRLCVPSHQLRLSAHVELLYLPYSHFFRSPRT